MQQDFEGAYEITADTLRIYNSSGIVVSQAMIRSVRASMQLSLGRHEEVIISLREAEKLREATIARWCDALIPALKWRLSSIRGEQTKARKWLTQTMKAARNPKIAVGLRLWAYKALPEILSTAIHENVEPEVAKQLIRRFAVPPPVANDETWPWLVKIYALGNLEILINDLQFKGKRKSQHKVLELLKVLIASDGQFIALDTVAEWLWPDAEGDTATGNLRTAVHRLREMLEHDEAVLVQDKTLRVTRGSADGKSTQQVLGTSRLAAALLVRSCCF